MTIAVQCERAIKIVLNSIEKIAPWAFWQFCFTEKLMKIKLNKFIELKGIGGSEERLIVEIEFNDFFVSTIDN